MARENAYFFCAVSGRHRMGKLICPAELPKPEYLADLLLAISSDSRGMRSDTQLDEFDHHFFMNSLSISAI